MGFVVVPFAGMDLGYAFFMPMEGATPQQNYTGKSRTVTV